MVVTGRAKVDGLIIGDSFLTVNPICLYRLILAPPATVYYRVERTIYIKGERHIPEWFSINLPTFFSTGTAGYTFSLLKLKYFAHFALQCSVKYNYYEERQTGGDVSVLSSFITIANRIKKTSSNTDSHESFLKKSSNSSSTTTHLPITFCPLR